LLVELFLFVICDIIEFAIIAVFFSEFKSNIFQPNIFHDNMAYLLNNLFYFQTIAGNIFVYYWYF